MFCCILQHYQSVENFYDKQYILHANEISYKIANDIRVSITSRSLYFILETVRGFDITRELEDLYKCSFDRVLRNFKPTIHPHQYRLL